MIFILVCGRESGLPLNTQFPSVLSGKVDCPASMGGVTDLNFGHGAANRSSAKVGSYSIFFPLFGLLRGAMAGAPAAILNSEDEAPARDGRRWVHPAGSAGGASDS